MASKEQAATSIRATLDQLKQLVSGPKPPKLSESDTKANFIEKYMDALGYQGLADITREYYVKNSQEFIDYMLKANGEPTLAVEAKALQVELTDKAAAQLVQYCAVEGIEWCVLTNGWELRLYNQYLKGNVEAKLILKLDLLAYNSDEEYEAIFEQLWLISKDSMTTPSGIRTWMEHQQLDKAIRSLLLDPSSSAVKYLRRTLSDQHVQVSTEAVSQWFRSQLVTAITPFPPARVVREKARVSYEVPAVKRSGDTRYWLLPAGDRKNLKAGDVLRLWLDKKIWGMNESTPGRKRLKEGDLLCFYAAKVGVVASAEVAGPADRALPDSEAPTHGKEGQAVYRVPLRNVRWISSPVALDGFMRSQLEAFKGRPPSANWAWFVQSTSNLSPGDFEMLTSDRVQFAG